MNTLGSKLNLNNLKLAATVVGSVAGIVTGIDKIKTTLFKWHVEYKEQKAEDNCVPPTKHTD